LIKEQVDKSEELMNKITEKFEEDFSNKISQIIFADEENLNELEEEINDI
jgi:hypothetical protein